MERMTLYFVHMLFLYVSLVCSVSSALANSKKKTCKVCFVFSRPATVNTLYHVRKSCNTNVRLCAHKHTAANLLCFKGLHCCWLLSCHTPACLFMHVCVCVCGRVLFFYTTFPMLTALRLTEGRGNLDREIKRDP